MIEINKYVFYNILLRYPAHIQQFAKYRTAASFEDVCYIVLLYVI